MLFVSLILVIVVIMVLQASFCLGIYRYAVFDLWPHERSSTRIKSLTMLAGACLGFFIIGEIFTLIKLLNHLEKSNVMRPLHPIALYMNLVYLITVGELCIPRVANDEDVWWEVIAILGGVIAILNFMFVVKVILKGG